LLLLLFLCSCYNKTNGFEKLFNLRNLCIRGSVNLIPDRFLELLTTNRFHKLKIVELEFYHYLQTWEKTLKVIEDFLALNEFKVYEII